MDLNNEINQQASGASFVRADLHIHSFGTGGSYDVTDSTMTPQNIVDMAIAEKIKIISVTDHNEINNSEVAINYAIGKQILVIPGVEVSTSDGHLLLYFPDFASLRSFYGRLNVIGDKKLCNNTIVQCLDLAKSFNGFGIAAHIDVDAGFELYMKGYTPFKEAILLHPNLLGLEIKTIASESWFTDRDTIAERKALIAKRQKALNEDHTIEIAKVMNSDAHNLNSLGKNSQGNKKITRIKLDELTFSAFKIALIDSSARVRIEDLIPQSVGQFVGVKFDGGFLDGQTINLSKNLTCIIGGRGAGKSSVLESIRLSSGNSCRQEMVDNEIWPERISLIYEDETGRQQVFIKDKLKTLINYTDPANGITQIPIESFGQGETAQTIQDSARNPAGLLNFLDEFIDFENYQNDDDDICQKLLENQTAIERLSIDVNSIPEIEKLKKNADDQVAALKAKNAKEVVELEEGLAAEKNLRSELVKNLNGLVEGIKKSLSDKTVFQLVLNFKEDKVIIGKKEFKEVRQLVEDFSKNIDKHSSEIGSESGNVAKNINDKLKEWLVKEKDTQDKIEAIRKDIESKGGKLDMAFIRKVTKDVSDYASRLAELNIKKKDLAELYKERTKLVDERRKTKNEIYRKRYEFAYRATQYLKATVVGFNIDIKVAQGVFSPELALIIKEATGWRTIQVPKADTIVKNIEYNNLLQAITAKNHSVFQSIIVNGQQFFSQQEAIEILRQLSNSIILHKIERCPFDDIFSITLTRKYDEGGVEKFIKKDFSQLSLGQQQSILLSILLFSNKNCPLLIDQPEDNLDSEFIYKTLVKNLRKIKELRQVIIVTHNANIAVLGDAELIIPLKSTSEKTRIMDRGSIDNSKTKKITCDILEGGENAFKKRQQIYGV